MARHFEPVPNVYFPSSQGQIVFDRTLYPDEGDLILYRTTAGATRTAHVIRSEDDWLAFELAGVEVPLMAVNILGVAVGISTDKNNHLQAA